MGIVEFLQDKPLYYTEIDYERMPRIYEKIKHHFKTTKIIHLIGTNGKGTTGRFLATALHNKGLRVGHYTSPHIVNFNERIWISGTNILDASLEIQHTTLQTLLSKQDIDSLSYFEYTTFIAMLCFNECEYIVLEAGLGGSHDATAVFPKILTLVTPISYDHEAFLGSSIESIANEKLGAIQNHALIADQKHDEVYAVAKAIEEKKHVSIGSLDEKFFSNDKKKIDAITKNLNLAPYLKDNLMLSIAALNFLGIQYKESDFTNSLLFGRLTKINQNIIVDVGHNPLAAQSILASLKGEKYILVYNSYADKEYKNILALLKPIIKHVEILCIEDDRIEKPEELHRVLMDLKIEYAKYKRIEKDEKYLVFGSFLVVEKFLKVYDE